MDMKVVCFLLVSCFGCITSKDLSVTCVPEGQCAATDQEIKVKIGSNVTLFFTVPDKVGDHDLNQIKLLYNHTTIMGGYFSRSGKRLVRKGNKLLGAYSRFTSMIFTGDESNSIFQVSFINMSMHEDDGNMFEYTLFYEEEDQERSGSRRLLVLGGPTHCGSTLWKESYDVELGGIDTIDLTLCGNPMPNISASISNKDYNVDRTNIHQFQYKYSVSLAGITVAECGSNMSITAVGDSELELSAKINLLFTPAKVENISAFLHHNGCMVITWDKIEAGNCHVTYEIQIKSNAIPLQALEYKICNASRNDTVAVRALINGRSGDFSLPVRPSTSPAPVFTKAKTTSSTNPAPVRDKSKQSNGTMEWKYILAIVVGVIALVLITAVIVVAVKKKDKSGSNNNEGGRVEMLRPFKDVESEYAEVNTLRTLLPSVDKSPPPDDQQMVYAELGPGGGRLGPKHVPEESNYAQVKTEGVHYPDLQQPSYRDQHSFSVGTRRGNEPLSRPPDRDDYDDYDDEDIIV